MPDEYEPGLVTLTEFGRRMGVSDTAVHNAIGRNRVFPVLSTTGKRRLLEWPKARDDWNARTDFSKKTVAKEKKVAPANAPWEPERPAPPPEAEPLVQDGDVLDVSDYAKARTAREGYQARLAQLEYLEKSGKLVSVETVQADAYKVALTVRDTLLNIPDRLAAELAAESSPEKVHLMLSRELRAVIESLRADL